MSGLINIAITGLKLSQLALSITGQNIVNANTEGYSRQSISTVTTDPLLGAAGYVGTGVSVTSIFRNTQAYLVDQVTSDIAVFEEFNLFLNNINQADALLADPSTSLSAGIDGFFRALNESANDPASLVGRQLLLAETKLLVNNFKTMESKLLFQNHALNRQFDALATNVATIAEEIAELNAAIANSRGVNSGKLPNDLLDTRDILVNELAELVSVTVIRHSNETIDVFIGQGQGLVIGPQPRKMISLPGALEPDRRELAFDVNGNAEVITKQLTGGQIGALIRFRSEALEPALNALGRIALAISSGLNDLQKLGIDLEGSLGVPMFTDINDPVLAFNRVRSDSNNLPPVDRILSVTISDISQLTTSDYEINFPGPGRKYSITRLLDNKLVLSGVIGGKLPQTLTLDGFDINFLEGTFQPGDKFLIQPTKNGAGDINTLISRPEAFAFATPIRTESGFGNQGAAFILPGLVTDVSTSPFTVAPGQLSPPILIRFTSANTYDVLDYSDPANPVSLQPPLNNQLFSPGVINEIFPSDPGGTTVSTRGSTAAVAQFGSFNNGYQEEIITILTTQSDSGFVNEQSITVQQNQSVAEIVQQLSALAGVTANASSQLQLFNFTSDNSDVPLTVSLNGVDLTDPSIILEGEILPQVIDDPPTSDFLRDRINNDTGLKAQGIFATSDGFVLTIRSTTGVNLSVDVGGNSGDSVQIRDGDLRTVVGIKDVSGSFTIDTGSYFDVDLGFGSTRISLTPGIIAFNNVEQALQTNINAFIGPDVIRVSRNSFGRIVLEPVNKTRILTITNVTSDDPLGISPHTLSGPDLGDQPAQLANGISTLDAFDFSGTNGTFLINIDGTYSETLTLAQNYPAGAGTAIVNVLQNQIDASVGAGGIAGRVTVTLDAAGILQFTTTAAGVNSRLTISGVTNMQSLVLSGFDTGEQTSGTQAQLVGNFSITNGFNFNSDGPHTFNISVDGSDPVPITLTGDTGTPAVFSGTVNVSAGVDFSGVPNTFDLTVSGNPIVVVNLAGVDTTLAASPTGITPPGIVTHVQTQIDAILGSGIVSVDLDLSNQLRFTSSQTGGSASITVTNPTGNVATNVFPVVGTAVGTQLGATGVVNLISGAINSQLGPLALGPITVGISPSNFLTITSPTYGGTSQISITNVVGTLGAIFPGGVAGAAFTSNVTVGGIMDIKLEGGATLTSSLEIGLLTFTPEAISNYLGYQVSINSGQGAQGGPVAGDTFLIKYNSNGTADNRNGLAMLQLNTKKILANSNHTYQGAYGQLVEEIGIQASHTRLSFDASQSLLRQSQGNQQAVSGVSLDEEAARLIQLEQHFNASAQLIALARELFNAILDL